MTLQHIPWDVEDIITGVHVLLLSLCREGRFLIPEQRMYKTFISDYIIEAFTVNGKLKSQDVERYEMCEKTRQHIQGSGIQCISIGNVHYDSCESRRHRA